MKKKIAKFVSRYLKKHKINVKLSGNNVYCFLGRGKKLLLLNSHLDTISPSRAWTMNPFKAQERNGRIYGRGACDAKASLAAMIDTIVNLKNLENAKIFAKEIGYPVLVRPSYVLSGVAMKVAFDESQLEEYLKEAAKVSREHPVVISKFVSNAKEVEVDGVCDGKNVFIGAIIEHVEEAGTHSGDATMSIPTISINEAVKNKIREYTRKIARKLCIRGPFNIQYLVKNGSVYVIECNLRASRSMPFVSKATGTNLMSLATSAILGQNIVDGEAVAKKYCVKSPQFSFMRLEGADPVTGVEMVSTGEVACFGGSFEEAFLKAMIASGLKVPKRGESILISAGDKSKIIEAARKLSRNGFKIYATEHTAEVLINNKIYCEKLYKVSESKKPNILDFLINKEFSLVINIPDSNEANPQAVVDEYVIRRKAVEFGIPVITNPELANTLATILENHVDLEI